MRHDSQQGERIGFWFHLGFAAMYALAFAWHLKGAREHARDMKRETPFEHLKRNADAFTHDVIRRHNPEAWAEYNVQYTDLSDFCTLAPEGWWCSRRKEHEGPCAARPVYDAYGESKATALYARRVDKDF